MSLQWLNKGQWKYQDVVGLNWQALQVHCSTTRMIRLDSKIHTNNSLNQESRGYQNSLILVILDISHIVLQQQSLSQGLIYMWSILLGSGIVKRDLGSQTWSRMFLKACRMFLHKLS